MENNLFGQHKKNYKGGSMEPKPKVPYWVYWLAAMPLVLFSPSLPASGAETIVLDGSTGMLPLARALAKAYQQKSRDPELELGKGLGTGARLRALAEGKIQIALASHGIEPAEVQKGNLKVIQIAKGAIVFAVNGAAMSNLTEEQVCGVYSGKITDWQALGASQAPIVVMTRPPTEVDSEVIREKIGCFKNLKVSEDAQVMARGGDMAKGLSATANAIGMTSMTVVEQSKGRVKALTLNGVAPSAENVKSGRYFLTRDFYFVVKGEPTPSLRKFLDFVLSPEGDHVITANGAIPMR
jgi:phosphate transport system substrate-binding protein